EPRKTVGDLVQPLTDNQLTVAAADPWNAARQLIPQVYAVAADDQRLRELASRSQAGEADIAAGFDLLRQHYPMRREFHHHRVDRQHAKERLGVVGFQRLSSPRELAPGFS